MDWNIGIVLIPKIFSGYILATCKFDEDRSRNPGDYEVTNFTFWYDTAKVGISHRISEKVLDLSLPNFQNWYVSG